MPLDDFLLRDETILASARTTSNVTLYATNKRVIRHEKGFFKEKMDSLSYPHIVGASLESKSYVWLAILGIILAVVGALTVSLRDTLFAPSGILFIFGGILLVVIGIIYRPAWYQLKVAGLTGEELSHWRTANAKEDAKTFARFIQDQISIREIPPTTTQTTTPVATPVATKEKEVIIKEVVMVTCDYCGALLPQTATFCPNCGAKRK
jgi:ribosomal protein L40E